MKKYLFIFCLFLLVFHLHCTHKPRDPNREGSEKIHVIFDTDANNEVDDQHALAYLLFNGSTFIVEGVTVNATRNGGNISEHFAEAERIITLCNLDGKIPLLKGANLGFAQIEDQIKSAEFDGSDAVTFIIEKARIFTGKKLVLIAVGKLTNIALAIKKEPSIIQNIRVVWLGSNYPDPGEYNQDNDTIAMNFILNTSVDFDMVTVRYGKLSGTDAVRVTQEDVKMNMPGKGPELTKPVTGRHHVAFTNFGDYSVNLFEHIDYYGDPPSRALFDMVAVAILKNPSWGEFKLISSPLLVKNQWIERPENLRMITIWENFNRDEILEDFYHTMDNYSLVQSGN